MVIPSNDSGEGATERKGIKTERKRKTIIEEKKDPSIPVGFDVLATGLGYIARSEMGQSELSRNHPLGLNARIEEWGKD